MYESLTQYLLEPASDKKGVWIYDKVNDGTPEHPKQMPYVNYSKTVRNFIHDVYSFVEAHEEIGLYHYSDILEANGIEWGMHSMSTAVVENLDAKCILALIFGAVRADRFYEGALLEFFENGSIARWLERLKELDTEQA
ncbi:MAG: DUF6508 domain-containing protein [Pseudoramibacter sp.]